MKQKKCKYCKELFYPYNSFQKSCLNSDCLRSFNAEEADKKWKKRKVKLAKNLKTLSEYKKELQKEINKLVRVIDGDMYCICCGSPISDAGHYHSVGSNDSLRFNLDNIHGCCRACNGYKGGNIQAYDLGLIDMYGRDYWEYVKFELVKQYKLIKLDKEQIETCKKIVRALIKNHPDKLYNESERLELRQYYNDLIGIYL